MNSANSPTVDLTIPDKNDFNNSGIGGVALVEGSGPHLSAETANLLHLRLRAAALVLFAGFGAFFVLSLINPKPTVEEDRYLFYFHGMVTAVLGLCGVSLCRTCGASPLGQLRFKEALIFGLPAVFFLVMQHQAIKHCCHQLQFIPDTSSTWLLLMFVYAMFIPNSWRRAGIILGMLALVPVLHAFYLRTTDANYATLLSTDYYSNHLASLSLIMVVSAIGSTYGVFTIGRLRQSAFQAKRLGQYYLKRLIGAGGMGEVYLAEHQLLKRPCAIKLIRPERAGDQKALVRFAREVQAASELSHWNTIDIYDYGRTDDGTFYYVMEYLVGLSLADLVSRHGPLPAERVIYLLRQCCDALQEAHGRGLVHRDITPGNIFAARRGGVYDVVKILDFGLVKSASDRDSVQLTQDGVISGSPLYMSPEQVSGDAEPDARSDIYSLGGVAYFLLTGKPPFHDDKAIKVLMAHMRDPVVLPSALQSSVPSDLESIVVKCLAKAPNERFSSATELSAALSECAAVDSWGRDQAWQWWHSTEVESPDRAIASYLTTW